MLRLEIFGLGFSDLSSIWELLEEEGVIENSGSVEVIGLCPDAIN